MGRRSKIDLYNLTDRVLSLHQNDKLTIEQITDVLRKDGYEVSRGSVQRELVNIRNSALQIKKFGEEAKVILEAVRNNPNTEIIEAGVSQMSGLFFRQAMQMEELVVNDPVKFVHMGLELANAQTKITATRMTYQNGFEEAKKSVLESLKRELNSNHPDILDRLTMLVGALEPAN